jgi:hypothetical protein
MEKVQKNSVNSVLNLISYVERRMEIAVFWEHSFVDVLI